MKLPQVSSFIKICESLQDQPMNVKLAYKLAKIKTKLQDDEQFYTEKLQEIIKKYAQTDEDGNYVFTNDGSAIKIKDGQTQDCQDDINELDAIEVEMPNITLTLDELDSLNLTINQMELLLNFIEE